ncbi:MAG TPA: hypothetical protein VMU34_14230 [Mycobacterium sp.]|nr:hypothetical protein [Mycobacterium sp.]
MGGDDHRVLKLNRLAQSVMTCETDLAVVPGAPNVFSEHGALEKVAELARDWLVPWLAPGGCREPPLRTRPGSVMSVIRIVSGGANSGLAAAVVRIGGKEEGDSV